MEILWESWYRRYMVVRWKSCGTVGMGGTWWSDGKLVRQFVQEAHGSLMEI